MNTLAHRPAHIPAAVSMLRALEVAAQVLDRLAHGTDFDSNTGDAEPVERPRG